MCFFLSDRPLSHSVVCCVFCCVSLFQTYSHTHGKQTQKPDVQPIILSRLNIFSACYCQNNLMFFNHRIFPPRRLWLLDMMEVVWFILEKEIKEGVFTPSYDKAACKTSGRAPWDLINLTMTQRLIFLATNEFFFFKSIVWFHNESQIWLLLTETINHFILCISVVVLAL